ncbi:hypothetical protein [Bacillus safensis]|uniref:hypothetical protein n=1 Tax=Bacillus safensis TaxID=561879 RepID=UPI003F7B5E2D
MTIKLSNLPDDTKIINESGFLLQTVAETKEDILERGERHHEDKWTLLLDDDAFGDEVEIDVLPVKIVCPHCKSADGFYTKERVTGSAHIFYNSAGDLEEEQGAMYDGLSHHGGTKAYCKQCYKLMGKTEDLASGNNEEETWWG